MFFSYLELGRHKLLITYGFTIMTLSPCGWEVFQTPGALIQPRITWSLSPMVPQVPGPFVPMVLQTLLMERCPTLDDTAATNRMEPSKEFEEGGQEIQPFGEEDSIENRFGDEFEGGSPVQSCDDLGGNSLDLPNMVTEGEINSQTEFARHENSSITRHF